MNIVDFREGSTVNGFYMVKSSEIKPSVNKPYLDLNLVDSTGEINAKIWDASESLLEIFKAGSIVNVVGTVSLWRSSKQLKIQKFRPVNEADNIDISHFIPTAPIPAQEMYHFVIDIINQFKNEDLRSLTLAIVTDRKDKLMYYPAAKSNHHAIRSGLLYHLNRMLKTASALKMVYSNIDLDLLQAGIILHDICKIDEMAVDSFGLVSEYSIEGNLLGHITMGVNLIGEFSKKLRIDPEVTLLLQHMVLSHHGIPEYGSPVMPMFLEAQLLHNIDVMDAQVYDFEKVSAQLNAGELSEPIFTLDKRRVYKTKLDR